MHCDRVRELLSPYLDEALPAQDRAVLAAHLESCQDCARFAADLRRLARTLSALGRERTPTALMLRLRRALAGAQAPASGGRREGPPGRASRRRAAWPGGQLPSWRLAP